MKIYLTIKKRNKKYVAQILIPYRKKLEFPVYYILSVILYLKNHGYFIYYIY